MIAPRQRRRAIHGRKWPAFSPRGRRGRESTSSRGCPSSRWGDRVIFQVIGRRGSTSAISIWRRRARVSGPSVAIWWWVSIIWG